MRIIGITQEHSAGDYYLVFYREMRAILTLERVIRSNREMKLFQYSEFDALKEIGAGAYGTVYKAKCKSMHKRRVVLKRFKNFDQMPELFVAEVSND
jgi:hypothetical protein